MVEVYDFKGMKVLWVLKTFGFNYDKSVTTEPPRFLEKAAYGFRICILKRGIGMNWNYKGFMTNYKKT